MLVSESCADAAAKTVRTNKNLQPLKKRQVSRSFLTDWESDILEVVLDQIHDLCHFLGHASVHTANVNMHGTIT